MVPTLIISSSSKKRESIITEMILHNKIPPASVFIIRPDRQVLTIEQIREINNIVLSTSSLMAMIIYEFDTSRVETQNAFLKTLEEGGNHVLFILTAQSQHRLLSTVQSRLRIVRTAPDKKSLAAAEFFLDPAVALGDKMLKSERITAQAVKQICDGMLLILQNQLGDNLGREKRFAKQLMQEIIQTRHNIDTVNLNPQHALDHLLIYFNNRNY